MAAAAEHLGVRFNADLRAADPHAVDEFIDSDLRRVRLTWEDLRVTDHLRDLGEEVWQGLLALEKDPGDESATGLLDQARASYRELHGQALAITHDARMTALAEARAQVRRSTRRRMAAQTRTTDRLRVAAGQGQPPPEPSDPARDLTLGQVGGSSSSTVMLGERTRSRANGARDRACGARS